MYFILKKSPITYCLLAVLGSQGIVVKCTSATCFGQWIALYVHFKFWYISLPSLAKQQHEITNSRFGGESEYTAVNFSFSFLV